LGGFPASRVHPPIRTIEVIPPRQISFISDPSEWDSETAKMSDTENDFRKKSPTSDLPDLPRASLMKTTHPGYVVRHVSEAPTVPCPCGQSTRPLTSVDTSTCSLHVTSISDSLKHYHRETTEVYYILSGTGKMELNNDTIEIEPGLVILIEPGTRHRVWSENGIQTIVFSVPAFRADDEFFDEPEQSTSGLTISAQEA
jgi:mannose-6-phosphate isomerase-like protein (cupin superfamily)